MLHCTATGVELCLALPPGSCLETLAVASVGTVRLTCEAGAVQSIRRAALIAPTVCFSVQPAEGIEDATEDETRDGDRGLARNSNADDSGCCSSELDRGKSGSRLSETPAMQQQQQPQQQPLQPDFSPGAPALQPISKSSAAVAAVPASSQPTGLFPDLSVQVTGPDLARVRELLALPRDEPLAAHCRPGFGAAQLAALLQPRQGGRSGLALNALLSVGE